MQERAEIVKARCPDMSRVSALQTRTSSKDSLSEPPLVLRYFIRTSMADMLGTEWDHSASVVSRGNYSGMAAAAAAVVMLRYGKKLLKGRV